MINFKWKYDNYYNRFYNFNYKFFLFILSNYKKIIGGKNKVYFINFFIAIYFIGIVVILYQIYKITVIDAKCKGIKHPKFMRVLALSSQSSEGIILYLLHRRKDSIKNITLKVQNEINKIKNVF